VPLCLSTTPIRHTGEAEVQGFLASVLYGFVRSGLCYGYLTSKEISVKTNSIGNWGHCTICQHVMARRKMLASVGQAPAMVVKICNIMTVVTDERS